LADDSVTALTMHRMILAGAGYDLLTAQDGQEGHRARYGGAAGPHPDGRGHAPEDRVRSDADPAQAGGDEGDPRDHGHHARGAEILEICFQCGCNDYINKPVDGAVLLAKVRSILGN